MIPPMGATNGSYAAPRLRDKAFPIGRNSTGRVPNRHRSLCCSQAVLNFGALRNANEQAPLGNIVVDLEP